MILDWDCSRDTRLWSQLTHEEQIDRLAWMAGRREGLWSISAINKQDLELSLSRMLGGSESSEPEMSDTEIAKELSMMGAMF